MSNVLVSCFHDMIILGSCVIFLSRETDSKPVRFLDFFFFFFDKECQILKKVKEGIFQTLSFIFQKQVSNENIDYVLRAHNERTTIFNLDVSY